MIPMLYGKNPSDFSETWMTSDKSIPVLFVVPKVSQVLEGLVLRFLFLVKKHKSRKKQFTVQIKLLFYVQEYDD